MQSSRFSRAIVAAGTAASISLGAVPSAAVASTADTTRTILYTAAAIGAIILYNNYQHKRQAANQVVGYTANGGTVYGDGRIVLPNGATVYPNANGQYPWGTPAYYNDDADYYGHGYGGIRHDNGLHRGWYKHHGNPHGDDGDSQGRGHEHGHGEHGEHGDHGG
ncbi:hypothetical protein WPS_22630 [Vulcanimicrobium alpinum]|uniref:Uncharacterized protein n=1 Tax=Vulcanimicrobium alpinum TaxID=3016050 RepID=A0AAN2CAV1_UNVUL|nr:hypothetical protein [Vulcanimicrobium alpinum]BDE06987.1 hypothetical protein WPS_22630 [Vulcanimicrobium alpinum]